MESVEGLEPSPSVWKTEMLTTNTTPTYKMRYSGAIYLHTQFVVFDYSLSITPSTFINRVFYKSHFHQ